MTARQDFTLTLKLRAPFLFPGIPAGRFGYDRVALRDDKGQLVIPRDQIRGVLLHALRDDLGEGVLAAKLFGRGSGDALAAPAASYDPAGGCAFFTDLVAPTLPGALAQPYHRVRIDPASGAALEGHLLTIELPAAPGTEVTFTGGLTLFAAPADAASKLAAALEVPLSIGALKSVGFGEIVARRLDATAPPPAQPLTPPPEARLTWTFALDRPYLVDADRIAGNSYLGREAIPGGALKGLIAAQLTRAGPMAPALSQALTALRIGFSQPPNAAPPRPLSLAASATHLHDLTHGQMNGRPIFAPGWKARHRSAAATMGYPEAATPRYDERVHTAIEPGQGRAAEGLLFSEIAVIPDGPHAAILDFTHVDAASRQAILTLLAAPLVGLGRTNAVVTTAKLSPSQAPAPDPAAGPVTLIVKTPALLADYSDGPDPETAYRAFWASVLPASPMTAHFAAQELRGGYQALRYRVTAGRYRPWLLTRPGSVFTLNLAEADRAALTGFLQRGLCRASLDGTTLDWKNCPFTAENGYGEIALHHPRSPVELPA